MSDAERVVHAWHLSVEQYRLSGTLPHESGLCRSVASFVDADVRFMVVGAYALALHGRPRDTGETKSIWSTVLIMAASIS